jgi:hypothetical protein
MDGSKRMGWSSNTLNTRCLYWKYGDERINSLKIDRGEGLGWLS